MAITGTLSNYGDEDVWREMYRQEVIRVLNEGSANIAGEPIMDLPNAESGPDQAAAVENHLNEGGDLRVMEEGFVMTIKGIDKTLPPGPRSGFQDPLYAIDIQPIIDLLINLGIDDPIDWITVNLEPFMDISREAIEGLSNCENELLAEELSEIDSTINVEAAEEGLDEVCGFEYSPPEVEIPPTIVIPEFSFDFGLPAFDLPTFDPFIDFNPDFPSINWVPIYINLGLIEALKQLVLNIADLVQQLIRGLFDFLIYIVKFVINIIMRTISFLLDLIGQSILFVAELIAFIKLSVIAFSSAFVGFLINKGIVAFIAGILLGISI